MIPAVELNDSIRTSARQVASQAADLNKALTELQTLLQGLPPDLQPPRHKLVEMMGRFTENVGIIWMVCTILAKSLDPTTEEKNNAGK